MHQSRKVHLHFVGIKDSMLNLRIATPLYIVEIARLISHQEKAQELIRLKYNSSQLSIYANIICYQLDIAWLAQDLEVILTSSSPASK